MVQRLCPLCRYHPLKKFARKCDTCKAGLLHAERDECWYCGTPLIHFQKKYCATCSSSNPDFLAQQEHRQREAVLRSKRKSRFPDWTEEDWRLYEERRITTRTAKEQAAMFVQKRSAIRDARHAEWYAKKNRVNQRRRNGNLVCYWCEQVITDEDLKRGHRTEGNLPKFHNRTCLNEYKKYFGFYRIMASFGNESQARYKAEVGEIPSYVNRSAAVSKANKEAPKRAKKRE